MQLSDHTIFVIIPWHYQRVRRGIDVRVTRPRPPRPLPLLPPPRPRPPLRARVTGGSTSTVVANAAFAIRVVGPVFVVFRLLLLRVDIVLDAGDRVDCCASAAAALVARAALASSSVTLRCSCARVSSLAARLASRTECLRSLSAFC